MADEEPTRRSRVPYEWILGAMFVATFYFGQHIEFFLTRAAWLFVALPLACVGFGVERAVGDPKPRSGWLLHVAVFGWLYLGALYSAADARGAIGDHAYRIVTGILLPSLPVPPALCFWCLTAVARKPRTFREFATFSAAATLLPYAWIFDLMLTGRYCGAEPPKPAPVREAIALALTLAPLAWAVWLTVYRRRRGSPR